MITIQIDRNSLANGMADIEKMIGNAIKADIGAKNVNVRCGVRNWQGHTCPFFTGKADGVSIIVHGIVSPYDLDFDPMNYPMDLIYDFA